MRESTWWLLWLAVCSCVAACGGKAHPARVPAPDGGLVIENVTVISSERAQPLANAFVVIRDGRVAAIGSGRTAVRHGRRIDGRGGFLIPGLIDSHVHIGNLGPLGDDGVRAHPELLPAYRTQLPRAYLAFGFTTLVDLDVRPNDLEWYQATKVHPHLHHCGRAVRIAGGYMAQRAPATAAQADEANLVSEPGRAETWPPALDPRDYTPARAVERVARVGGICVKTFVEPGFGGFAHWPVPRAETLRELGAEARRRGLVFLVHANAVESWAAALDARADVIAHGLWHWPGAPLATTPPPAAREVIEAAARTGTWVQPTLRTVFGGQSIFDDALMSDPRFAGAVPRRVTAYLAGEEGQAARRLIADEYRQAIAAVLGPTPPDAATAMAVGPARAMATLRLMVDAKVKLLFGTDTSAAEGIGNPPGLNGRLELGHMAAAGVPLAGILRAATLDNAAVFGLTDRGTVEVGKTADLLLLRANPLQTVEAYDEIDTVFLSGEPIARPALMPQD
jgi:imidazolonepropionase-like amidohydrolase